MRHLSRGRNLSRTPSHRKALLHNLALSILDKERIVTTVAKAKEVRGVVERLITYGKKGDLNSIRIAGKTILDKTVLKKLFADIAPFYKDREGGYTRIVKLGDRKGDNAPTSIIELVGRGGEEIARSRKNQKNQGKPLGHDAETKEPALKKEPAVKEKAEAAKSEMKQEPVEVVEKKVPVKKPRAKKMPKDEA